MNDKDMKNALNPSWKYLKFAYAYLLRTHPIEYSSSHDIILEVKYEALILHFKNQCLVFTSKFIPHDYGNFPNKLKCFGSGQNHLRT